MSLYVRICIPLCVYVILVCARDGDACIATAMMMSFMSEMYANAKCHVCEFENVREEIAATESTARCALP